VGSPLKWVEFHLVGESGTKKGGWWPWGGENWCVWNRGGINSYFIGELSFRVLSDGML